jgi:hypothetical protein
MTTSAVARLVGIKAKIERANQHIHDLECAMRAFRDQEPYGFGREIDPNTGDEIHRIEIRQQTPIAFSLITGDALHNLRSALDHLAWKTHEADGGTPDNKTSFPIYDTAAEYKAAPLAKKQKFSPRLISLFEAVQPYQSGYELIGVLHELNIIDKHHLLLMTAFGIRDVNPTWKTLDPVYPFKRVSISNMLSGDAKISARNVMGDRTQDFLIHSPVGASPDGTLGITQDGAEIGKMLAPFLRKITLTSISLLR